LFGFGVIWHISWMIVLGLAAVVITLIIVLTRDPKERVITGKELAMMEAKV